jgi:hypothetical protein
MKEQIEQYIQQRIKHHQVCIPTYNDKLDSHHDGAIAALMELAKHFNLEVEEVFY